MTTTHPAPSSTMENPVNDVMAGWYEVRTITVTDVPAEAPDSTP